MNISTLYIALLVQGTCITLVSWFCAGILSLCIGTLLGIMSCREFTTASTSLLIRLYTFIAKGIPAYVQILIAYFVIPAFCNISISGFTAAIGALAFCSSGYVTEIVKAGINTVCRGQWQACAVLGYSTRATLIRIILPQAFRIIMPALLGELEQLLKSTSLLATIGITELTRAGMNIISRELNPIPVYLTIAIIYLLLSALLTVCNGIFERRKIAWLQ